MFFKFCRTYNFSLETIFTLEVFSRNTYTRKNFKLIFILYHNIKGRAEGLVCSHIYACRKKYGELKNLKWDYGLGKNGNLKI